VGIVAFLREAYLNENFGPFVAFRENYGFVPNFFRAQGILPRLIEAQAGLEAVILKEGKALSRVQKQQIQLLIAAALQDTYWVTARRATLKSLGIAEEQVERLLEDFRQAGLPTPEVALLEFCLRLSLDWQSFGTEDIEALRSQGLDDYAILEAVLTCALSRFVFVISAGLRPTPDFEPYQGVRWPTVPARKATATERNRFGHAVHSRDRKEPYIRTVYLSPKTFPPFAGILKTHGFIPNVYRAQSLRPDVLAAAASNVRAILVTSDALSRKQKECIFVAVSAAILNSYCVAAHCNLLRGMGLSPEEGDQVAVDHHQTDLPVADKEMLDFALKLAIRPFEVGMEDIDRLRALGFSDEQILECEAITGLSNYVNMLYIGLGAEPDFDLPPSYEQEKVHLLEIGDRPIGSAARVPAAIFEDPDADLVARAQAGDLTAFEELIRRHSSTVYRALMAILGNAEEAQDAMQDALLSAFRHIRGFQGRAKFSTWLLSIVRNTAVQRLRDRKDLETLDEASEGEEDFRPRQIRAWQDNPEQLHSKEERRRLVEKSILGLPAKYRVVVMLRDIEQLSTEEVARQLGLTVPAMKTRLLRGRLMLREALAPHFAISTGKAAI
jgi:RNA polymerase sigma-70 factor (ECF subfamily)